MENNEFADTLKLLMTKKFYQKKIQKRKYL